MIVWENVAIVAITVAPPPTYTLTADVSTASIAVVETIFYTFLATCGVAVFALNEYERCVNFTTTFALGSEPSETDYVCCGAK